MHAPAAPNPETTTQSSSHDSPCLQSCFLVLCRLFPIHQPRHPHCRFFSLYHPSLASIATRKGRCRGAVILATKFPGLESGQLRNPSVSYACLAVNAPQLHWLSNQPSSPLHSFHNNHCGHLLFTFDIDVCASLSTYYCHSRLPSDRQGQSSRRLCTVFQHFLRRLPLRPLAVYTCITPNNTTPE